MDLVARTRRGLEEAAPEGTVHRAEVGRASRRVPEAPAAVGVVVLDQEGVGEPHPVVRAAAAPYGVLLESAQAGRRLARVEKARVRPLERVDVGAGRGRDPRQPLDEVERDPLGRQDRDRRSFDPGEDGPRGDPVAVLDEDLDRGGGVREGEDARQKRGAGDDSRLAADEGAGDAGLWTEDRESGDVLSVLRERARQEVVQGFDEASIDLHEKSILDGQAPARQPSLR